MKDIRQKLLATFRIEHRDHVEQIRSFLATVAGEPVLPASAELEEAFRRAHSLKGAARAVDLSAVEGLAHRLETLFSRVRQGALLLDRNVATVAQQVLDASEDCVNLPAGPAPGFESSLRAIEQVLGMKTETAPVPAPATAPVPTPEAVETVRIATRSFDGLLRSAAGLLTESLRQNQVADRLDDIARQLAAMEKETESRPLASFLRSIGKQTAAARRLQQRSNWTMRHLGRQLEQDVWQARMLPVEGLLEGYRKMVRDLARDDSKEIEFHASSTGVNADRLVLEALKDPLMHLLRNTISHGIETPPERLAKGKAAAGSVVLRIEAAGQRLTITVADDGRGVDFARVAEVAVQQGMLAPAESAQRSPAELSRFLFRPGFSTARSVTSLAGRGMGLSVVYEAVRRLQGEVGVEPADGGGTSFRISVPLSISTHTLLLVSSGSHRFAIPVHAIERLHRVTPGGVEIVEGQPFLVLDGQPVPLYSIRDLLRLEDTPASRADAWQVMILRAGGKRAAVTVDAFLRHTDSIILDLGPAAAPDGKVSGGILLEDGSVAFVLNVMELLEASVHRGASSLLKTDKPERENSSFSILVVDDSLTTRTLEKSILEAHGYKVRVAVDGIDAIEKLRREKADLVISDIQMPRLDGFGLLEALRKDPDLGRIPVIMVTSLDRPEDQQRGLSLGAGAYIVKRKFDQTELLSAIRQVL